MESKLHHWFKSCGGFAEWVNFAYWWSFIGGGSAINGGTPSSLDRYQEVEKNILETKVPQNVWTLVIPPLS